VNTSRHGLNERIVWLFFLPYTECEKISWSWKNRSVNFGAFTSFQPPPDTNRLFLECPPTACISFHIYVSRAGAWMFGRIVFILGIKTLSIRHRSVSGEYECSRRPFTGDPKHTIRFFQKRIVRYLSLPSLIIKVYKELINIGNTPLYLRIHVYVAQWKY
jgi:hypothetical protein